MADPVHEHRLEGCTPTPLAGYLKALGVLRLLSSPVNNVRGEAADAAARGWWQDECLHLRTRLDRDALQRFFLEDYAPSPIIAPWNGRAGFLEEDEDKPRESAKATVAVENSKASRLEQMRETIDLLRGNALLSHLNSQRRRIKALKRDKTASKDELAQVRKEAKATKSALLPDIRSRADPRHLEFIDACFVLAEDERAAPLLGSGGNDGSRDFGVNFAEALSSLVDFGTGVPTARAEAEIEPALFGSGQPVTERGSMGQFGPGQGGANGSTGYEGWNPLNQWDIVLALEGTLVWSGALTRRWGAMTEGRAAFPFTFEPSGAGAGGLSAEDPNRPRGEIWTPIWDKPSIRAEIDTLFAEGRLTVGRSTASTGLDAARSVAQLGIARGISAFERYTLIQPDAKMPYQATPLGRFRPPSGRPHSDLIADLDAGEWLAWARRLAREKTAPARAREAMRRLEDALFEMTRGEGAQPVQAALSALGGFVDWLANSRAGREKGSPPPRFRPEWLWRADDRSPEFRVAEALASLGWPALPERSAIPESAADPEEDEPVDAPSAAEKTADEVAHVRQAPRMTAHLAPVAEHSVARRHRRWAETDQPTVVWGAGGLVANMIAVLERRLVEQAMRGLDDKPLAGSVGCRTADIAAFLHPGFDDARCAALLAGLVWAQPRGFELKGEDATPLPFAYAALKPLFSPDATLRETWLLPPSGRLPVPPGLTARLRRGDVDGAVRDGLARARASGLASPFDPARLRLGSTRFGAGVDPRRLAAALLIPLRDDDLKRLARERAYPEEEETDDAA